MTRYDELAIGVARRKIGDREWAGQMTPYELKQARLTLGLTLDQMAMVLGYVGAKRRHMQYDLETGRREIREPQRRLVAAYLSGYRSDDWPEETT